MQQMPNQPTYSELQALLLPLSRQLERLEDRTRDLVTRTDLADLRKEVVTRDLLQAEINRLNAVALRNSQDIKDNEEALQKRIDAIETRQMSRQELLAMRIGGIGTIAAFLLALFDFLAKTRLAP